MVLSKVRFYRRRSTQQSALGIQPMKQQLANSNWQLAKETAAGDFCSRSQHSAFSQNGN
jgi:hypothetical protein